MADTNNLRATALFTLLLITEAMYTAPMREAKREMSSIVHEAQKALHSESTCKHKKSKAVHTIGCLTGLTNEISDCELVSILGTYLTEATDLDIQTLVTEKLQAINQFLQSIQKEVCKSEPEVKNCDAAFKESDGDYEKHCKVMSLLGILKQWLSR